MKKLARIFQTFFAAGWLVFGAQHFLFADFVASLVPAFFPARLFWAYATGAAMIAAGVSLVAGVKARLAAALVGLMLMTFILLIHIPKLVGGDLSAVAWTRFLQDAAIASGAFMLAGALAIRDGENDFVDKIARISRYVFAVLLIVFGASQFLNLEFLTAKVPAYLPARMVWVYLTGTAMIVTGVCVLANKKARIAALALGALMLTLNLLLHVYLLARAPHVPLVWTAAMLDLLITCGAFFLAVASPAESAESPVGSAQTSAGEPTASEI